MKETVLICNNAQLIDWMENGTLEIMLAEVFSTQHNNLTQAFLFGSKFSIDFPSKNEWHLEAPDEARPGEYMFTIRQSEIKRYHKQRINCLVKWLADILREDVLSI